MQPWKVFVVHRWAGDPSKDWYPWMTQQFNSNPNVQFKVLSMTSPNTPTIENWVGDLEREIPQLDNRTILVGHSVGTPAM
jgi:predicted alpha/beta hydrolase family esterase